MRLSPLFLLLVVACGKPDPEDTGDPVPLEDEDADGYTSDIDCDDQNVRVNPGADEECDGIDNDCDGYVDADDPSLTDPTAWYLDADADGYGSDDPDTVVHRCERPDGYVERAGDCDDTLVEVNPGADEVCDGRDDDCNGVVDDAPDAQQYWADGDGDGWGDDATVSWRCEPGSGWVQQAGDCDDGTASVHPDAEERCNGVDDDCDGSTDGDDAVDQPTWYPDNDGDGVGQARNGVTACEQPSGYAPVTAGEDCDDGEDAVYPGATEICDGLDNDCDGRPDDEAEDAPTWYRDQDADGFGAATFARSACDQPTGYVADARDCDDGDAGINPSAAELCDGDDNDCDGTVDEPSAVDAPTWYGDADGDGYGIDTRTTAACSLPTGYAATADDCDDGDAAIHPRATELCDGVDNDCDGDLDDPLTVLFTSATGATTDVSATFRGGSSSGAAAYTVATSGTLSFCEGTYYALLTINGAHVTVEGPYGASSTVLSAAYGGSVITVGASVDDLSIEGLTLLRGDATDGGGLAALVPGLALDVDDCVFGENAATRGGAMALDGVTATISGTSFSGNDADEAGGAIAAWDSDLDLLSSTLDDNTAPYGGALWLSGGGVVLNASLVQDNIARATSGTTGTDDDLIAAGAGAFLDDGATLACSALSSATAGFLGNASWGEAGAVYQAIGSSVSSSLCDWGAGTSASADNTPSDLYVQSVSTRYAYSDNASFSCTDAGCI